MLKKEERLASYVVDVPTSPRLAEHGNRLDPRLLAAIAITVLFHGGLLATGSHRRTYDAFVHLFFADHYRRDWFSTWDPRWYTGFPTISYPPGTHQLLAVFGRLLGTDNGYVVVQLSAAVLLVIGVYRFANVWQGPRAAGWAALAAAVSSSLAEVIHVFGQLPTTAALALLLNAQPSIRAWIVEGRRRDLLTALALLAATSSVHHVTTLFGSVFFTGPMVIRALLDRFDTPSRHERSGHTQQVTRRTIIGLSARRTLRVTAAVRRTMVLGVATVSLLVVVILPYWLWSSSDPISQVPIPHGSRDNFLRRPNTGLVFWVVPWASCILLLPFAAAAGLRSRAWPLAGSVMLLTLLGTGGTTPVPRILLGGAFDILTLDRFTIWATFAVLPLAGTVIERLITSKPSDLIQRSLGRHAPRLMLIALAVIATVSTLFASSLTNFRPTQPDPIDPDPIVAFLEKDDHDRWRYLMLGFGDQMANVSARTTARTVDGNYHSARRLPELTSHSVERLEGAKFRGVPGLGSLQEFIGTPSRYNLKFVFSNDSFYDPMLWASGWQRVGALDNDIIVWQRPDVPPLLAHEARPEIPSWQRLLWGILPLTALFAAAVALLALARQRPSPTPLPDPTMLEGWLARRAAKLDTMQLRPGRVRYGFRIDLGWLHRHDVAVVRGFAALALITVATVALPLIQSEPSSPDRAVASYYEHIDFQRFEQAWAELDASTRPTLDQYLTTLSLRDGLLDGYAKLESIEIIDVEQTSDEAAVTVFVRYLTSVETIERTITHVVRWDGERWGLVADPPDQLAPSTDTLTRTQQTTYQVDASTAPNRRLPASADRPRVQLGPTRIVAVDDQWYVVGEVTNIDDRPAYVTIDITARDANGEAMATVSPSDATAHTARPGETIPFLVPAVRIVPRTGVGAGEPATDFDPDDEVSPVVETEPASLDVAARAVVATRGLERDLQFEELEITGSDQATFSGNLINAGALTVTIPRVLVAVLDDSGRITWVHDLWIRDALRPGQRTMFSVLLERPAERARLTGTPINAFADDVTETSSLSSSIHSSDVPESTFSVQAFGFRRTEIE